MLNAKQLAAVFGGLAVAIYFLVYPPWDFERKVPSNGMIESYVVVTDGPWSAPWGDNGNLFNPPQWKPPPKSSTAVLRILRTAGSMDPERYQAVIDFSRLGVAWCLIILIVGVAVVRFKKRTANTVSPDTPVFVG